MREHVQDKWEELADELGLDDDETVSEKLKKIKDEWKTDHDSKKAAFDVLKLWLTYYKTSATWRTLIDALQRLKLDVAVNSVQKHLSGIGKY